MRNAVATTNKTAIEQAFNLIFQGIESWIQAGKIISKALDENPQFADEFNEAHPEVSVEMIYAFDRIGRNELHPKLLLSDKPGIRKLRRLPIRLQEKYLSEPVKLLVKNGQGKWENLNVDIYNLTPTQAMQVFDGQEVRNEAAQRAWVESKTAMEVVAKDYDEPFRVSGHKLIIMEPCQLSSKQVAQILAQMS